MAVSGQRMRFSSPRGGVPPRGTDRSPLMSGSSSTSDVTGSSPTATPPKNQKLAFRTIDSTSRSKSLQKGASMEQRSTTHRATISSRQQREVRERIKEPPKSAPLKGGYFLFFLVLGLAVGKDLFDMLVSIIDLLGLTVVLAPLSIFFEMLNKVVMIFVDATILFYFWFTGGRFALRLVITSLGAIIDAVPMLNILPVTTLMFVLAFLAGRVINKVSSTAVGGIASSALTKKI